MQDNEELTDDQLDAAFNEAAAEADSELALTHFGADDEHEDDHLSPDEEQPDDDINSDISERVQPQQQEQVLAPPRPAAQNADVPAWINSIGDNATREQALSDWNRLRHSEASQRGRVASLNRKWSEAQDLLSQRERSQAAGEDTAAEDDKLAAIKEDFPALAESLEALMEQKDRQWEQKFNRYAEPLNAIEQQQKREAMYEQGALVAEKHPDWASVAGSDGFSDWVSDSPHRTAMFNSDDAASTIELLDLFKAQHGLLNKPQSNQQSTALRQRRRSQLSDLASLPNGGSGRMPLVDESDEDAIFAAAAKAADAELRRYR
jgi:hypothetical protein